MFGRHRLFQCLMKLVDNKKISPTDNGVLKACPFTPGWVLDVVVPFRGWHGNQEALTDRSMRGYINIIFSVKFPGAFLLNVSF